jgi:ribonucleoside-diphosphate reductase alpha chain
MPLDMVIKVVSSLQTDSDNINSWKDGVAKALKRYLPGNNNTAENTDNAEA